MYVFFPVCAGVCVCLCHCLGYNFWRSLHRNFISDFDVNFDSFGPTDTKTYRHRQTHTYTIHWKLTCTHMPSKTSKKGNFLHFGIAIVFQIVGLMFGWLVRQSKHMFGRVDMFGLLQYHYRFKLITYRGF